MQLHPVSASLSGLTLSAYSEEDIRKLAACRIVTEQGLDNVGLPIRSGYYDPAMGPRSSYDICETCGLRWKHCPGHVGYIELPVYCYNHFFFRYVLQLYKLVCHSCYRFIITDVQAITIETGLLLLDAGLICDMHHIFSILNGTSHTSLAATLAKLRQKAYDYLAHNPPAQSTSSTVMLRNQLQTFLFKLKPPANCPHCASPYSQAVKRSAFNIYLIPPKAKRSRSLPKKQKVPEDDMTTQGQDQDQIEKKEAPKPEKQAILSDMLYCTPIMVLKELNAAVSKNRHLFDLLFGEIVYQSSEVQSTRQISSYDSDYTFMRSVVIKNVIGDAGSDLSFPQYRRKFQPSTLFVKTLLVPPNRQRVSVMLNQAFIDNPLNSHLLNILTICNNIEKIRANPDLVKFISEHSLDDINIRASHVPSTVTDGIDEMGGIGMFRTDRYNFVKDPELFANGMVELSTSKKPVVEEFIDSMLTLQIHVSRYMDGTVLAKTIFSNGIKQMLEKKEGLFRMNIMGKRGNYAGRSVIAPDANLDTDEIGLPEYFAKKLTFPEPINEYNVELMARLIINGPTYPGASVLIDESGSRVLLTALSYEQRKAIAHTLLVDFSREPVALALEESEEIQAVPDASNQAQRNMRSYDLRGMRTSFMDTLKPPKILLRHTLPNDFVILNRQPTLHKHSMVALRVRVLPSNAQTLRFHFASCKGLNADFDGDECCVLKPQTHEAASEYANLVHADSHFISVTSGEPIRGLIQDHVIGGIFLCAMGTFFDFGTLCEYIMVATGSSRLSSFEQSSLQSRSKEQLLGLDLISKQTTTENVFGCLSDMKYMGVARNKTIMRAKSDINVAMGRKYSVPRAQTGRPIDVASLAASTQPVPRRPTSFFEDYSPPSISSASPQHTDMSAYDGFHTQHSSTVKNQVESGETNAFSTRKVTVIPDSHLFSRNNEDFMFVPQPAIVYPAARWTGKAVITSMLYKVSCQREPINYVGNVKIPTDIWGPFQETESKVIIIGNTLLTGIVDKQHIASTPHGLAHAIFELYGHNRCGWFLSNFGRLATYVLQRHGFTCSVEDMVLRDTAERSRYKLCEEILASGAVRTAEFLCEYLTVTGLLGNLDGADANFLMQFANKESSNSKRLSEKDRLRIYSILRDSLSLDTTIEARLDSHISNEANLITTSLMKACNPSNLVLKMHSSISTSNPYGTPRIGASSKGYLCNRNMASQKSINCLAYMVLSGAKGSTVNLQMMTTCLGQQNLEGRRVPSTQTGKTLPSHIPYEHCEFIQGGYVIDRFLTGIRPSSFFFHCQAGREGLIDTAIKTASSGYFQRVLVKNMEGLVVAYDGTVRRSDNMLVQLLYGGDGVDTTKTAYLQEFEFMYRNQKLYMDRFIPDAFYDGRYLADSEAVASLAKQVHHDVKHGKSPTDKWQALRTLYEGYTGASLQASFDHIIQDSSRLASALRERHEEHDKNHARSQSLISALNSKACELVEKYVSLYKKGLDEANLIAETHILQPTQKERDKLIKYLKAIYLPGASKHDKDTSFDRMTTQDLAEMYTVFKEIPIHMILSPYLYLGSTSPEFSKALDEYISEKQKHTKSTGEPDFDPVYFRLLAYTKFIRSLIAPGSAVGVIAAQSTGEPSTQLTLNTFHLAGHGGVNATMGVPRLREIIMTRSTSSPIITMSFKDTHKISVLKGNTLHTKTVKLGPNETMKACKALQQQLRKIYLRDVLRSFVLKEYPIPDGSVRYELTMKMLTLSELLYEFNFNVIVLKRLFAISIPKHLARAITKEVVAHKAMIQSIQNKLPTDTSFPEYTEKITSIQKSAAKEDNDGQDGGSKENSNANSSVGSNPDSEVDSNSETDNSDGADSGEVTNNRDDEGTTSNADAETPLNSADKHKGQGSLTLIDSDINLSTRAKDFLREWISPDIDKLVESAQKAVNTVCISLKCIKFSLEDTKLGIPPDQMPLSVTIQFVNSDPSHVIALATIEKAIRSIVLKEVRGITRCFVRHELPADRYVMDIEGGNLRALFYLTNPFINFDNIYTNNISQILEVYGIEAARNAIIEEIHRVFSTYHIEVDERHLSLIADSMTLSGCVRGLNRLEMRHQTEEILKASFESACTSIAAGALTSGFDSLRAPAGAIAVGQYPSQGTGSFDLLSQL